MASPPMRPRHSAFPKCIVDGKLRFTLSALDISGSCSSQTYICMCINAQEKSNTWWLNQEMVHFKKVGGV